MVLSFRGETVENVVACTKIWMGRYGPGKDGQFVFRLGTFSFGAETSNEMSWATSIPYSGLLWLLFVLDHNKSMLHLMPGGLSHYRGLFVTPTVCLLTALALVRQKIRLNLPSNS
jgi:hypothetical protein